MGKYVKKPGYMGRAVTAFVLLNAIMLGFAAALVWVAGEWADRWFVMIPIVLGMIIAEAIIMGETIAPIIKDWINQEEYVSDEEMKR